MLTSDNAFIKDWIEKHYLKDIQKALSDLYNLDFQVLIEVDPTGTCSSARTRSDPFDPCCRTASGPAATDTRSNKRTERACSRRPVR